MVILSLVLLLSYLCYTVWVGKGIPDSLSATYYLLGDKGWLFQVVVSCAAFMLLPTWMDKGYEFLPFLSCGGLLFVASSPSFRIQLEGKVHYISAIICGMCSVLWIFLMGSGDIFLPCFVGAIILSLFDAKKYMWWFEIAIIASVYYCLI